jgi:hypothetical protein
VAGKVYKLNLFENEKAPVRFGLDTLISDQEVHQAEKYARRKDIELNPNIDIRN